MLHTYDFYCAAVICHLQHVLERLVRHMYVHGIYKPVLMFGLFTRPPTCSLLCKSPDIYLQYLFPYLQILKDT